MPVCRANSKQATGNMQQVSGISRQTLRHIRHQTSDAPGARRQAPAQTHRAQTTDAQTHRRTEHRPQSTDHRPQDQRPQDHIPQSLWSVACGTDHRPQAIDSELRAQELRAQSEQQAASSIERTSHQRLVTSPSPLSSLPLFSLLSSSLLLGSFIFFVRGPAAVRLSGSPVRGEGRVVSGEWRLEPRASAAGPGGRRPEGRRPETRAGGWGVRGEVRGARWPRGRLTTQAPGTRHQAPRHQAPGTRAPGHQSPRPNAGPNAGPLPTP